MRVDFEFEHRPVVEESNHGPHGLQESSVMNDQQVHRGRCFCGAVEVRGDPAVMGGSGEVMAEA